MINFLSLNIESRLLLLKKEKRNPKESKKKEIRINKKVKKEAEIEVNFRK